MQKNIITNKITPCCNLPFSEVWWWVSNLNLNSEADRQFIISKISQSGTIAIDGWKVLINSGTLESDAALTKPQFLAWFDCKRQPSCEQLKLIIEGFKVSNFDPTAEYGVGWTEISTYEAYNDKIIKKVVSYVGGVGAVPAELTANVGKYYATAGGFTSNKDLATNFKDYANGVVIPKFSELTFPVTGYIQAVYNGSIYELPSGQTSNSSDTPSTSSKWVKLEGSSGKIDFLIESKSIIAADYNSCTWVDGSYYESTGNVGSSVTNFSRITNYIPVVAGDEYGFYNSGTSVVWYNDSNAVVGSSGDPSQGVVALRWFVAPVGATKCRINILTANKTAFVFYRKPVGSSDYAIKKGVIKLGDIDGVNVLFTELANYSNCTWVAGQYLDSNGTIQSLSTFNYCSNYIPVEGGKSYTFKSSGYALVWYDVNQAYIGAAGNPSDQPAQRIFIAPAGAKFCRINQASALIQSFSFRLANSDGGTESVQIPQLQIYSSQIIGGSSGVGSGSEEAKNAKIGDVKLFNFTANTLTGNAIVSGDSTVAAYDGGTAIANILKFTGTVTNIAVPGETIAQQLAHWNALSSGVRSAANFVFVQIGLNDIAGGSPAVSVIIQSLQNYINKIKLDAPNAMIVGGEMLPCKQRYIDILGETEGLVSYGKWKALNASLKTMTNVNRVATVHGWLLNDGNDNLKNEFQTPTHDNIHENDNGRKMIAYSWLISTL